MIDTLSTTEQVGGDVFILEIRNVSSHRGEEGRMLLQGCALQLAVECFADLRNVSSQRGEGGLRKLLPDPSSSSGSSRERRSLNIIGLSSAPKNLEPRCLIRRISSLVCKRGGGGGFAPSKLWSAQTCALIEFINSKA